MRLIVLDDNEAVTWFVAAVAARRGWETQTATHRAAFRQLIDCAVPDAIMLDLQLDKGDGIEELGFLRTRNYAGAIVLMSGFDSRVLASAQQVGNALGLQMVAVLEKPARAARVAEILATIEQRPTVAAPTVTPCAEMGAIAPAELATAIEAGRMVLHLQPIVSAVTRDVKRAEALIRWRDPVRGLVPPDAFVPIAETDEDLIDRLTHWVGETAAAHYQSLVQSSHELQICINISGRNLHAMDFPDRMAALCERMAVPVDAIGLEITESVAMHDLDTTTAVLARLRLKGFSVAIDDFGTGHSSLSALRRMPFSIIKIDKSFVRDLLTSNDSLTIVRSVVQLARDMRMSSVAEGVEDAAVAQRLVELGIDALQGYHFSRPLPLDAFQGWLNTFPLPRPDREAG